METANHEPARTSADGKYLFLLTRRTGWGHRAVTFIMRNPSATDAERDDATIRRCIGFAIRWGFALVHLVYLSPWRRRGRRTCS